MTEEEKQHKTAIEIDLIGLSPLIDMVLLTTTGMSNLEFACAVSTIVLAHYGPDYATALRVIAEVTPQLADEFEKHKARKREKDAESGHSN